MNLITCHCVLVASLLMNAISENRLYQARDVNFISDDETIANSVLTCSILALQIDARVIQFEESTHSCKISMSLADTTELDTNETTNLYVIKDSTLGIVVKIIIY